MTHLSAATGGTRSAADPFMSKSSSAHEDGGDGGRGVGRGGVEGILREKGGCGRGNGEYGVEEGTEEVFEEEEEEEKYDDEEKENGGKQKGKEEIEEVWGWGGQPCLKIHELR